MKAPNIWNLNSLFLHVSQNQAKINDEWVPSRPLGLYTIVNRIKCAWMVFIGKGDVLLWPKNQ